LIIAVQDTVENVGDVFFWDTVYIVPHHKCISTLPCEL